MTLRQARRCKDITQNQLAKILGIHVQTYRKIEENPELATIAQATAISKCLEMSYDEIFFSHQSTLSRDREVDTPSSA